MIYLDTEKVLADQVLSRLQTVLETDKVKVSLRVSSRDQGCIRLVTYWEVTDKDVDDAIDKLKLVIKEFDIWRGKSFFGNGCDGGRSRLWDDGAWNIELFFVYMRLYNIKQRKLLVFSCDFKNHSSP